MSERHSRPRFPKETTWLLVPVWVLLLLPWSAAPGSGDTPPSDHLVDDVQRLRKICRLADQEEDREARRWAWHFLRAHDPSAEPPLAPKEKGDGALRLLTSDILKIGGILLSEELEATGQHGMIDDVVRAEQAARSTAWPEPARGPQRLAGVAEAAGFDGAAWQLHDCAVNLIQRAYGTRDPAYVHALEELGIASGRMGSELGVRSAASRAWSVANRLRREDGETDLRGSVLLHRGLAYEALGDTDEAVKSYDRAWDLLARSGRLDSYEARRLRERLGVLDPRTGPEE